MSSPFVAEIRIFAGNFAPTGWATCDGQILPISQNTALFSLLGTTYGGDGKTTFALPDLQGRAPMHPGQGPGLTDRFLGESSGSSTVTLIESEIPAHTHTTRVAGTLANSTQPTGRSPARSNGASIYRTADNLVAMGPGALAPAGGSLPHSNMQPYLTLTFIIALQGIFPPRG